MGVSHGGWEGETNKKMTKGLKEARKNQRWCGEKESRKYLG